MTGHDWLFVLVLLGVLALVVTVDGLRRLEERRAQRIVDEVERRQVVRENRGKP